MALLRTEDPMKYVMYIIMVIVILGIQELQAQNEDNPSEIEEQINAFTGQLSDNLQPYLQPFADAFGANLNNGLYHTAYIPERGFHLYVGVETMLALIAEDQRTYTAVYNDPINGIIEEKGAPTVFGSKEDKSITGTNTTVPGGFDIRAFPIIAPRITIGSLVGTELSFRWIELDLSADFGLLKINGFGLRHSISQYMPHALIDLSFGFFVQEFQLGRIFKADMGFFGVQASRKFGPLTLYGGLGVEKATVTLTNNEGVLQVQPVTFDSSNRGRMNVGACLSLVVFHFHADYTLGMQNVITVGLGIGF